MRDLHIFVCKDNSFGLTVYAFTTKKLAKEQLEIWFKSYDVPFDNTKTIDDLVEELNDNALTDNFKFLEWFSPMADELSDTLNY